MIKLIVTDLDNTLLNSSGELQEDSIALIKEARDTYKVRTAIATGRSFGSAKLIAERIGSDTPVICYNGSLVKPASGGAPIFKAHMNPKTAQEMIAYCKSLGLYLILYDTSSSDEIVVEKLRRDLHDDPDLNNIPYREVGEFSPENIPLTPKLMIATDPEQVPMLQMDLESRFGEDAYFAQSEPHLIEVMPAGVNKGAALRMLMSNLRIKKTQVMALGDNTNDALLLSNSGVAVAVANAVDSLKEIATYICKQDRSYGFNEAVKKFVLSSK